MNELTCEEVHELAAELALDALPGDQRAAALAHLDSCTACRALVDDLSMAADRLLLALPEADVPPLLSARLHRSVPPAAPAESNVRRRWTWMGAAAILVAIVVGGIIVVAQRSGDEQTGSPSDTTTDTSTGDGIGPVALVNAAGNTIGRVSVDPGDDPAIHMTVNNGEWDEGDKCVWTLADGSRVEGGKLWKEDGHGYYGGELGDVRDLLRNVELIGADGSSIATADLPTDG